MVCSDGDAGRGGCRGNMILSKFGLVESACGFLAVLTGGGHGCLVEFEGFLFSSLIIKPVSLTAVYLKPVEQEDSL